MPRAGHRIGNGTRWWRSSSGYHAPSAGAFERLTADPLRRMSSVHPAFPALGPSCVRESADALANFKSRYAARRHYISGVPRPAAPRFSKMLSIDEILSCGLGHEFLDFLQGYLSSSPTGFPPRLLAIKPATKPAGILSPSGLLRPAETPLKRFRLRPGQRPSRKADASS